MNDSITKSTITCLSCSIDGVITKVLRDDIQVFSSLQNPISFFGLFNEESQKAAHDFWENIKTHSAVFDAHIPSNDVADFSCYSFDGFLSETGIFVSFKKKTIKTQSIRQQVLHEMMPHINRNATLYSINDIKNKGTFAANELNDYDTQIELNNKLTQLELDNKLKDEQIIKLNKELDIVKAGMEQFSLVASHDLKEPLRMITSYMGLLKRKFGSGLDEKANTYIDFAIDGGQRLHNMFNDLIDLSQIGRLENQKELVAFEELLQDFQIDNSKLLKEKKVLIELDPSLPKVFVYKKSFTKLVENLLDNAVKFTSPNKEVHIKISAIRKNDFWQFCFEDNGIGIEEKDFAKIFAVFSRLQTKSQFPGNGIGLAICKKVVDYNGGVIWVDSEIEKGSRFYFTLPI